jgi:hypothetical protein
MLDRQILLFKWGAAYRMEKREERLHFGEVFGYMEISHRNHANIKTCTSFIREENSQETIHITFSF